MILHHVGTIMNPGTSRNLNVWQKAMDLTVEADTLTRAFPDTGRFGLVSRIPRGAASVFASIVEGQAIGLPNRFLRRLRIAHGPFAEVEAESLLAGQLRFFDGLPVKPFLEHLSEVRRMLFGLERSLERKLTTPRPVTPFPWILSP